MLSLLTLVLWFGGLAAMLGGHMLFGAMIAAGGFVTAGKALSRRDDMETFFGLLLLFVLIGTATRFIAWLWSALT